MLNTYCYSPGGVAAACLAGALLYYPLTHSLIPSVPAEATETLEVSDRGSGRLTLEIAANSEEEFKIAHRGSGRINPNHL
ncbi:MAG: hypothetical protein AAF716_04655 [Cyanobacteria bacterium P01_D01_bin.1]